MSKLISRHLTRLNLEDFIAAGSPATIKVDGDQILYLVISPNIQRLTLRIPLTEEAIPDVTAYRYFSTDVVQWNDTNWCDFSVVGPMVLDAYPVICSVADRIQIHSIAFGEAIEGALNDFREVLANHGRLSDQQETGLFGELLFFEYLLIRFSSPEIVGFWLGPEKEEHDFAIFDHDFEVKTTIAEARHHWINGLNQLAPKYNRKLWLVSFQLTKAANQGRTLSELISEVRSHVDAGKPRSDFNRKLTEAGWNDDTASIYTRRLRLRNAPKLFEVNNVFPALTNECLSHAKVQINRFLDIKYKIDVTAIDETSTLPDFIEANEWTSKNE